MDTKPVYLTHFIADILVRCPRCSSRAHLRELKRADGKYNGHRMVCPACIYERDWVLERDRSVPMPSTGPHLHGFDLDLWLVTPCCGVTLWAFNRDHLDFLAEFIGATLRPKARTAGGGWSNSSLQSQLPKWMLSGHNREEVMRGIEKLLRECG